MSVKYNSNPARGFATSILVALGVMVFTSDAEAAVVAFTHTDDNPYSPRNTQSVGPYDTVNNGTVTMWYNQYNKY